MSKGLRQIVVEEMEELTAKLNKAGVLATFEEDRIIIKGKEYIEGDVVWEANDTDVHLLKYDDWDRTFGPASRRATKSNIDINPDVKQNVCPRTHFITNTNIYDIYARMCRYVGDNVRFDNSTIIYWGKDKFHKIAEGDVIWEPREGYFIPISGEDYYENYNPKPAKRNMDQNNMDSWNDLQKKKVANESTLGVELRDVFIPRVYYLNNDNIEMVYNRMRLYDYTVYPYGTVDNRKIGIARPMENELVLSSGDVIMEPAEGVFIPFKAEKYKEVSEAIKWCRKKNE